MPVLRRCDGPVPTCVPDVLALGATSPVDLREVGCLQGDGSILLPDICASDDGRERVVENHLAGYLGDEADAMHASDEEHAALFEDCHG